MLRICIHACNALAVLVLLVVAPILASTQVGNWVLTSTSDAHRVAILGACGAGAANLVGLLICAGRRKVRRAFTLWMLIHSGLILFEWGRFAGWIPLERVRDWFG